MKNRSQWSKVDPTDPYAALNGDYLLFVDFDEVCSVCNTNEYSHPVCFYSKGCDDCMYDNRHDDHALFDYKCSKRREMKRRTAASYFDYSQYTSDDFANFIQTRTYLVEIDEQEGLELVNRKYIPYFPPCLISEEVPDKCAYCITHPSVSRLVPYQCNKQTKNVKTNSNLILG